MESRGKQSKAKQSNAMQSRSKAKQSDASARVTCSPGAPVSHVTPGRACHMLLRGARVTCYPLAPAYPLSKIKSKGKPDVQKGGAGNGTLMTSSVAGQKHRGTSVENCIAFLAKAAVAFSAKAGTGPADRPWATSRACGISTRWLG